MTENEASAGILAGKRVLIVGAGGFVGGYLVEEGLRLGCEVWAGVRKSTRRDRFADKRIHFISFDFENPSTLGESMREALGDGKWDYIIYNLGATKVIRYVDFNRINYEYLRYFTGALHQEEKIPEKLLYISSLSVIGPQGKELIPHTPRRWCLVRTPVTAHPSLRRSYGLLPPASPM